MTGIIQITTTVSDPADAERIAASLVSQQLAACVQISGPIESTYRWKGQVETSQEWVCAIKTREDLFAEVEQVIRGLHSYGEPEIMAVPITAASAGYREWLTASVKPAAG
ncbi:MAG: divalent-cation tolerance protein CutA [Planctomycetota bacterium]